MKKNKLYNKLASLLFRLIIKTSKRLFYWKTIQSLVRRFENAYGKQVAKAIGLFIELALVMGFYNLIGLAISYIKGIESDLIPILVNILAGLQLVINKYQRNIEDDILDDNENK